MKAKFGLVVVAGSGKLGGHVFTKNRAGVSIRTKVTPSNPRTPSQSAVRSRLTGISQAWASLSESQRSQWNGAASNFAGTNIFGDKVSPSGFNLYQKLNNNLLAIGEAVISVPPSPSAVGSMDTFSATAVNSTGAVVLTFSPAVPAGTTFKVFATESENAGKAFVKNKFRFIGILATGNTSPYTATTVYNTKFGAVGSAGKKIHFQLVGVNNSTGQMGQPVQATAIIS